MKTTCQNRNGTVHTCRLTKSGVATCAISLSMLSNSSESQNRSIMADDSSKSVSICLREERDAWVKVPQTERLSTHRGYLCGKQ